MIYTIPHKVTVRIVARRLDGAVQPDNANVVALPNRITYDIESMEGGKVLRRSGITPSKRIVSPLGQQVEIEAASAFDEATLEVLGTSERLFVRESLVFGNCE